MHLLSMPGPRRRWSDASGSARAVSMSFLQADPHFPLTGVVLVPTFCLAVFCGVQIVLTSSFNPTRWSERYPAYRHDLRVPGSVKEGSAP